MVITVAAAHRHPDALVEAAHTHAAFALTRYSRHIRGASIRIAAAGAAGGGTVTACRIDVRLARPAGALAVTECDADPYLAVARATARASELVGRRIGSRQPGPSMLAARRAGPESGGRAR